MKGLLCICVAMLFACSDTGTGSTTFISGDLTVAGNPVILGENATGGANPSGFLRISGNFDSKLGLALTGLKANVRVMNASGAVIGSGLAACSPDAIGPASSCTFLAVIALVSNAYTDSRQVEITPISDQGTGTLRVISVNWPTTG